MWSLTTLLVLLCFLSQRAEAGKLDAIIKKHYERFQKSPLAVSLREKRTLQASVLEEHTEFHHSCKHDHWMEALGMKDVHQKAHKKTKATRAARASAGVLEEPKYKRSTAAFESIRIFSNTDALVVDDPFSCSVVGETVQLDTGANYQCSQNDLITTEKISILQDLMLPAITEIISQILSLERVQGNLVLSTEWATEEMAGTNICRRNAFLPGNLFTDGEANSDFYVIWLLRPVSDSSTIANAAACNYEFVSQNEWGRPLAGSINFNPASLIFTNWDPEDEFSFARVIRSGIHELFHALGFSRFEYNYYRDMDTGLIYDDDPVLQTTLRGTTVYLMTTPELVSRARDHYGCSTLQGLELENMDPQLPGSHWETRLTGPEVMSPTIDDQLPISILTLALFNDMGWYFADYAFADEFIYGYNQGCTFTNEKCPSWSDTYFCDTTGLRGCEGDFSARGECVVSRYDSALPAAFQYFPDPTLGGDEWHDYCPTFVPYVSGYCEDPNNQATRDGITTRWNEFYGTGSKCFNYVAGETANSGCWAKRCVSQDSVLVLQVGINDVWYSCPVDGGVVTATVSDGTNIEVTCPPASGWCKTAIAQVPPGPTPGTTPGTIPGPPSGPPSSTPPDNDDDEEEDDGGHGSALAPSLVLLLGFIFHH